MARAQGNACTCEHARGRTTIHKPRRTMTHVSRTGTQTRTVQMTRTCALTWAQRRAQARTRARHTFEQARAETNACACAKTREVGYARTGTDKCAHKYKPTAMRASQHERANRKQHAHGHARKQTANTNLRTDTQAHGGARMGTASHAIRDAPEQTRTRRRARTDLEQRSIAT